MSMIKIKLMLLSLLLVFCSTAMSTEWCGDPQLFSNAAAKISRIHDKFYIIEVLNTAMMCRPGNVAILLGDDHVLLVDSVYRHANESVIKAIRKLSRQPIRYLINTHGHKDHADSNFHYGRDEGTVIVAHTEARNYLAVTHTVTNPDQDVVTLSAQPKEGLPEITFDTSMQVHFDDEPIHLLHVGPAHSAGDIVVHFTKSNVIHMGDLLQDGNLPFFDSDGNIANLIDGYYRVAEFCDDSTIIIPGHGKLSNCDEMRAFAASIKQIVDRIKQGIQENKSLQEIKASHPARDFVLPANVANPVDPWITIVYKNLMDLAAKQRQ